MRESHNPMGGYSLVVLIFNHFGGCYPNHPFCDGKHKGTNITPIVFENKKEGNFALCGCKKTGNPPYCNGAHLKKIKEILL